MKGLSTEVIIPQKRDNLVIKVLTEIGHNVLASLICHLNQREAGALDTMHVVGQVVQLFGNLVLAVEKCELVTSHVQFPRDLVLDVHECLAYAYLQLHG